MDCDLIGASLARLPLGVRRWLLRKPYLVELRVGFCWGRVGEGWACGLAEENDLSCCFGVSIRWDSVECRTNPIRSILSDCHEGKSEPNYSVLSEQINLVNGEKHYCSDHQSNLRYSRISCFESIYLTTPRWYDVMNHIYRLPKNILLFIRLILLSWSIRFSSSLSLVKMPSHSATSDNRFPDISNIFKFWNRKSRYTLVL